MSEPFPRDTADSNSYEVNCGGHIFTDQTVVFYMETTSGQTDDQNLTSLQRCIYVSAIMVSTACVYLSS